MRNEIKYILSKFETQFFLKKINAKPSFPPRHIYSLYYDSKSLKNFTDSEEGTVPRSKWRVRCYSNSFNDKKNVNNIFCNNLIIEKKETFEKHRTKKRIFLKNIFLEKASSLIKIVSKQDLNPNIFVTYYRNYYTLDDDIRITVDMNIKFFQLRSNIIVNERKSKDIIVEEKKSIYSTNNTVFDLIGDKHSRNSKYCEALKKYF
tara:strand:+ start:146 stop:757 length:612 start_codon:yes stop_codon:yes gene_type:complete